MEKKLIRSKNLKILFRDLIIIILITIMCFAGFKMYKKGYFNKYFYVETEKETTVDKSKDNNNDKVEDKEEDVKDLSFHEVALDIIKIDTNSSYIKDFYKGNLSDELLLSLAVTNIDKESIVEDEDSYILDSNDLELVFSDLFSDKDYNAKTFKYNGTQFKYLKSQNIYLINDNIEFKESNIIRYITDIEEEDNIVIIKTIEAQKNNNKLVNIVTKATAGTYKNNDSLKDYANKLNKLEYRFEFNNGVYKLLDINSLS